MNSQNKKKNSTLVVIRLPYINVSNQHLVPLQFIQCYVNYMSLKKQNANKQCLTPGGQHIPTPLCPFCLILASSSSLSPSSSLSLLSLSYSPHVTVSSPFLYSPSLPLSQVWALDKSRGQLHALPPIPASCSMGPSLCL